MIDILTIIFGSKHSRDIKKMMPIVKEINSLEESMKAKSDEELKAQTPKLRKMLESGSSLEQILPEAFATVREASWRVLHQRHFDVQLVGGIVLFNGQIAEMKTGEGKTLTATLPLYLHGLTQKGAHLVTVNDYLASRDAAWMGEMLQWLGITVGCIINDMSDDERQKNYACDVTYGTNNEFAFDYLRDNMKFSLERYVQRDHVFCIVDEVDSILIDEARTPLLISGPSEGDTKLYSKINVIIPQLNKEKHFTVDEKSRSAVFTDEGITEIQRLLGTEDLFNVENAEILHHLNQALKAHTLFHIDKEYVIRDNQVIIVDEFTGRLKTGSRWSDGLHQAVEAKEGVEVKSENQTLASITFQNYFKLYSKLAGMTGTADTEAEEFMKIYNLGVTVIPTNVPVNRIDDPDLIYKNKAGKYQAVLKLITDLHKKGQPVLVGTIAIEDSESLSAFLKKNGVPHEVLNAKQHEREAHIIAQAGQKGAVTIATNMAGRGTDIKLTEETKKLGGLYIIGTERHEARRIDNQLRGRSGRQGDPGHSKFFLSLDDDLMRIFGSDRISKFMGTLGMKDDEPIEHRMISNAIAKAQKKVETHNFEIRKHLLEYDNVMNDQRKNIYRIRKDILSEQDNLGFIYEMIEDVCSFIILANEPPRKMPVESWPWDELNKSFDTTFNTKTKLDVSECLKKYDGDMLNYFSAKAKEILTEKFSKYEPEQVKVAIREILLSIFDQFWKDHLLSMDHIKEGINLRAYAQKDPLNEYKRESFELFEKMREEVKKAVINTIFTIQLYTKEEVEEIQRKQQAELEMRLKAHQNAQNSATTGEVRRSPSKVGRNDLCPCGSGKKYKHCHGT